MNTKLHTAEQQRRLRVLILLAAASAQGWNALAEDGPNSSLYSGRLASARRTMQPLPPAAGPFNGGGNSPQPSFISPAAPLSSNSQGTPLATSWYEIPLPPPKEVKKEDIITIRVDLGTRVSSEGEVQRRKTSSYDAVLKDWVVLDGLRSVRPAPQTQGEPRIQGSNNQTLRTQAELETNESIKFDIAAKVSSILPNGTIVLEAHRRIQNNNEVWIVSLGGICRREDIQPGNVVLSKDIADLKIDKREVGHIRDSYKRGWITRLLDTFNPF